MEASAGTYFQSAEEANEWLEFDTDGEEQERRAYAENDKYTEWQRWRAHVDSNDGRMDVIERAERERAEARLKEERDAADEALRRAVDELEKRQAEYDRRIAAAVVEQQRVERNEEPPAPEA